MKDHKSTVFLKRVEKLYLDMSYDSTPQQNNFTDEVHVSMVSFLFTQLLLLRKHSDDQATYTYKSSSTIIEDFSFTSE